MYVILGVLGIFALLLSSLTALTAVAVAVFEGGSYLGMENNISPRLQQAPRPPSADNLYDGIYDVFVEKSGD